MTAVSAGNLAGAHTGGARRAVVAKVVENGRQAHGEHLLTDRAQQLGEEEPAHAGEAGVLVGEAGATGVRLDPVGDVGGLAVFVAELFMTQRSVWKKVFAAPCMEAEAATVSVAVVGIRATSSSLRPNRLRSWNCWRAEAARS